MTCPATDARECMLRHAHARHHRGVGPCLACETGRSRMSRSVEWPPVSVKTVHEKHRRRGRPRKVQGTQAPVANAAPVKAVVAPDAVRQAVRDALHLAEACALGLVFLAARCEADSAQLRNILEAQGMTIFKNEIAFRGEPQACVSVNKRLRTWAA